MTFPRRESASTPTMSGEPCRTPLGQVREPCRRGLLQLSRQPSGEGSRIHRGLSEARPARRLAPRSRSQGLQRCALVCGGNLRGGRPFAAEDSIIQWVCCRVMPGRPLRRCRRTACRRGPEGWSRGGQFARSAYDMRSRNSLPMAAQGLRPTYCCLTSWLAGTCGACVYVVSDCRHCVRNPFSQHTSSPFWKAPQSSTSDATSTVEKRVVVGRASHGFHNGARLDLVRATSWRSRGARLVFRICPRARLSSMQTPVAFVVVLQRAAYAAAAATQTDQGGGLDVLVFCGSAIRCITT